MEILSTIFSFLRIIVCIVVSLLIILVAIKIGIKLVFEFKEYIEIRRYEMKKADRYRQYFMKACGMLQRYSMNWLEEADIKEYQGMDDHDWRIKIQDTIDKGE